MQNMLNPSPWKFRGTFLCKTAVCYFSGIFVNCNDDATHWSGYIYM